MWYVTLAMGGTALTRLIYYACTLNICTPYMDVHVHYLYVYYFCLLPWWSPWQHSLQNTVDILVGWHIDTQQQSSLINYISSSLVSLRDFWVEEMVFSVELLKQFLEDMEAYSNVSQTTFHLYDSALLLILDINLCYSSNKELVYMYIHVVCCDVNFHLIIVIIDYLLIIYFLHDFLSSILPPPYPHSPTPPV